MTRSDVPEGLHAEDRAELTRLHERLERSADEEGLLELAYQEVASPIGSLLLVSSPEGVMRVAFEVEDHEAVLEVLAHTVSPRILRSRRRLEGVERQIDEYFEGQRRSFDVPLDRRLTRGFRSAVLAELEKVQYGETVSYTQLARSAGSPRAVRAVGTACATNPLPLLVPCHRVLRSDGVTGQYRGGRDAKVVLLELEAQNVRA